MKKVLIALLLALFVCGACVAWLDGGAQAQVPYAEPWCTCHAAICWYQPVDDIGTWYPVGWLSQVERWRIDRFWDSETWRCGR